MLLSLLCALSYQASGSLKLLAASPLPSFAHSGSGISVEGSLIHTQFDLGSSISTTSYPQDRQQEFQMTITLSQLMEITPLNGTTPSQVLDSLNIRNLSWSFTRLGNASETQFGQNLRGQLSAVAHLQRGSRVYSVNMSINLLASERQNETQIIASNWLAIEPVGGPSQIGLELSLSGWPFRTAQDLLALRILIDGSQGTVRHHSMYSFTGLFNTVGIINDVTQRRDASLNWLHRAIVDNGTTKASSEVDLNSFNSGNGFDVDIYYPSFTNSTLTHELIIETSDSFKGAAFVPIEVFTLLAGATTLLALTLLIAYLSRRAHFVLHRRR